MIYKEQLLKSVINRTDFNYANEQNHVTRKIHIGYGIDNGYARCMAASIASICKNNIGLNLAFHVMTIKLSDENIAGIQQLAETFQMEIHLYEIDTEAFRKLPTHEHLPIPTYFRFILPLLLEDKERVFYIDADIVCIGNFGELLKLKMNENIIAAVPDFELIGKKRNKALGLNNHTYFNAGMLVIDIKKWNAYDVAAKVMQVLSEKPEKFRYLDQDALNLILTGKVYYLDKKYNFINSVDTKKQEIIFLHFAAHPKPWNIAWSISLLCNNFTKNIYADYEQLTPWKGCQPLLPRNYKEMKIYAKCLLNQGDYLQGVQWYIRYFKTKFAAKL